MIIQWAQDWGFFLNVDKCRILQFGGKEQFDYHMDNIIVKKENKAKDLGIIVDNKLQWHDQIQSTVGKAKRRAFCLSRALISKNVKTWMLLYKGYIRSILEYGLTAYCPYQKGQLAALEGVQRWMTRQ